MLRFVQIYTHKNTTWEVFLENKNTAKYWVSLASYKQKLQAILNLYLPLTRYNFHL